MPLTLTPFRAIYILAGTGAAVVTPADATLDTLVNYSVAGGIMRKNGTLRITVVVSNNNNANNKTLSMSFGGVTVLSHVSTVLPVFRATVLVSNRGVANSQLSVNQGVNGDGSFFLNGPTLGAVDTTQAVPLLIQGQKAVAGDVLTLESFLVELLMPT